LKKHVTPTLVVGTPDRDYLWILSRTPQMAESLFSELIEFVNEKGFNTANLIKTTQV
jgi:apolipoprotein D and lipocalin family protein